MNSPTILHTILAQRQRDIAQSKATIPPQELEAQLPDAPPPIDFIQRLRRDTPPAVIAEIKRASPSRGDIAPDLDAAQQALRYAQGGAAAISVLTEPTWFKGTLADLAAARAAIDTLGPDRPAILRKDFIIDEYQLLEARVHGADAVLLIVAALHDTQLHTLYHTTRQLGMHALIEVNNTHEIQHAARLGAPLIGINNRNLHTFQVDLATTQRLATHLPPGTILAALSGINTPTDVQPYLAAGASAILVGESLMRAPDPAQKIRQLRGIPTTPRATP